MKIETSTILVPTDFTPVAECAIVHACIIASKMNDEVKLIHVVTKETMGDLRKNKGEGIALQKKMDAQCHYYAEKFGVKVMGLFREGSIFTSIGEASEQEGSQLIVMGTHGVKGVQHLVGAFALKVVASSKVPVVIVQHKLPHADGYLSIVSPIDSSIETKQKTLQTISVARMFNARVHLFSQAGHDETAENKIRLNVQFVTRHLEQHNIAVTETRQENKKGDFSKDFIAFAKSVSADLIIILTTAEKGLKDIMLGTEEQKVINNIEEIPVMCVNPLQSLYKTDALA